MLTFVDDVCTILNTGDDNVKRTIEIIRWLKKRFEGGECKRAA